MNRRQIATELMQDGYHPFLKPFSGSVVTAEAWTSNEKNKRLIIILYRNDTEEIVDLLNLPDDEEKKPDIEAFIDDFRENVFRLA